MKIKSLISYILLVALVFGFLIPLKGILQVNAAQVNLYGENLIQVTEPVIGESYYLGADVDGTMMYFCTPPSGGSVTTTTPYSLYTTQAAASATQVTLEDSVATNEAWGGGFQLTFMNGSNVTRIYCYDVVGSDGIMDTGTNTKNYLNRHTFTMDEVNGVQVLRKYGNNNILVVKYNEARGEWRMLGVREAELANAGVYPAMLLQKHTHSFVDGSCACGKQEPVAIQEGIYYLTGKVNGTSYYFRKTVTGESVAHTTPYSVCVDTDKAAATLVDVILESSGGYSLAYPYNDKTARIYVFDVGNNGTVDTGVNTTNIEANHHFSWDEENAYFYQMEGEVKYVLALKELKNSNTGTNQIRIQAVPESELSSTVVAVYPEAHTQHSCDSWTVKTPATTTTTGIKIGTCTVCGRQIQEVIPVLTPGFCGNSVNLADKFSIDFHVDKAAFEGGVYNNPYVIFEMDGKETTVSDYTQKNGYYVFSFDNILPDQMGKKVKATLYAEKSDGTRITDTTEYSVAQYCYDTLLSGQIADSLRRLLVDTLNFGAASQLYRNADITAEALVNADLTAEQRSWGTTGELRNLTSCRSAGNNYGSVIWHGVSMLMDNQIQMRVYFFASDISGLSIKAQSDSAEWTLTGDDIKTKNDMFYVDFGGLNPTQMDEEICFTAIRNNIDVSSTLHYSVESYAAIMLENNDTSAELKELLKSMIQYGDSAKAYSNIVYDLKSDVRYFGRTYETDGVYWFNWSSAGFDVRFQGSGLKAKIASNAPNKTNYAYLKVYVDGVEQTDILLDKTMQSVVLAEGLDPNEIHTIQVRKRNSPRSSTAGVLSLELLDGKKLTPAPDKSRLIEFIGDSLTVGYSAADVDKTETAWSTKTEDGTKTYSKQVADAFDAEYMITAISGRGVVMNNSGGSGYLLPEIYPELDIYNNPGVAYDFTLQPDVIVINLGTNDATNSALDIDNFKVGATNFLRLVRTKNPNAKIIWAYGLRQDKKTAEVDEALDEVISQLGDPNVYYLQLDLAADMHLNHPTAAAYAPSGEKLIEMIRQITGW